MISEIFGFCCKWRINYIYFKNKQGEKIFLGYEFINSNDAVHISSLSAETPQNSSSEVTLFFIQSDLLHVFFDEAPPQEPGSTSFNVQIQENPAYAQASHSGSHSLNDELYEHIPDFKRSSDMSSRKLPLLPSEYSEPTRKSSQTTPNSAPGSDSATVISKPQRKKTSWSESAADPGQDTPQHFFPRWQQRRSRTPFSSFSSSSSHDVNGISAPDRQILNHPVYVNGKKSTLLDLARSLHQLASMSMPVTSSITALLNNYSLKIEATPLTNSPHSETSQPPSWKNGIPTLDSSEEEYTDMAPLLVTTDSSVATNPTPHDSDNQNAAVSFDTSVSNYATPIDANGQQNIVLPQGQVAETTSLSNDEQIYYVNTEASAGNSDDYATPVDAGVGVGVQVHTQSADNTEEDLSSTEQWQSVQQMLDNMQSIDFKDFLNPD